jgi:hypothetical protein
MPLPNCLPAERMRGVVFSEPFTPDSIRVNGATVIGALNYDQSKGALFDGVNDYLTVPVRIQPFSGYCWNAIIDFFPAFAANANVVYYFVDTNGGSTSIYHDNTAGNNALVVKTGAGTTILTVLLAAYTAYWKVNQRNTLVITARTGVNAIYLNGVPIGTSATAWTAQAQTTLYLGATNAGATKFSGYFKSIKFFRGNSAADLLTAQEASDYYTQRNWNYWDRATFILPMDSASHDPANCGQEPRDLFTSGTQIVDGDMEAVGVGAWTAVGAGVVLSKVGGAHSGAQCLRVATAAVAGSARQAIASLVGRHALIKGWARGDGATGVPTIIPTGSTFVWTGTTSNAWQYFEVTSDVFTGLDLRNGVINSYVEFDDIVVTETVYALADGSMEMSGTASSWSSSPANSVLSKQPGTPHSGTQCLRVAHGGTANPSAQQGAQLATTKRYRCYGWVRSDGTAIPRIAYGTTSIWDGTNSVAWQYFDAEFTPAAASFSLMAVTAVLGQYCEFDDVTVVELRSRTLDGKNGRYALLGHGATVAAMPTKQPGRGYYLDSTDYLDLGVLPGMASPANQFTYLLCVKPVTLTTNGGYLQLYVDAANRVLICGSAAGITNRITCYLWSTGFSGRTAATPDIMREGTSSVIIVVFDGTQATDAGKLKVYVDGRLQTLTFAGAGAVSPTLPVGTGRFNIGKQGTTAANPLDSYVTFAALWPVALSPTQVIDATIW